MIYHAIGKVAVKSALLFLRVRYGRHLRFAAGFAIAALVIGAYLASRDVQEG